MDTRTWHILRVASGTEKIVAPLLGAPAYVPHRAHVSFNRRQRRVVHRLLPALPGLIFVRVERPREINTLLSGVRGWVRDGHRAYLSLSDRDFQDMRQLELANWRVFETSPQPTRFKRGDAVEFLRGSLFEGHDAIIERLKGNRAFFRLVNGLLVEGDLDDAVQLKEVA